MYDTYYNMNMNIFLHILILLCLVFTNPTKSLLLVKQRAISTYLTVVYSDIN